MLTNRLPDSTRSRPTGHHGSRLGRVALAAALCLLALCVAGFAPAAEAAPSWSAPVEVSGPGSSAYEGEVAVDPRGDAAAIWMEWTGDGYGIAAAIRPAGSATWGQPALLSAHGIHASSPSIAIDAKGDVVAVWQQFATKSEIMAATHVAGAGGWGAGETLSDPLREATDGAVAIDPQGEAVVVWDGMNAAGDELVQASAQQGLPGLWGSPITLSAPGADAGPPQIAMDAAGDTLVVWERPDGTALQAVQEAERPAGGSWTSPLDISVAGETSQRPRLAVDAAGDAAVVWERYTGQTEVAKVATRKAGGPWSIPRELTGSSSSEGAFNPEVGIDSSGRVLAAWEFQTNNRYVVQVRDGSVGSGVWSQAVTVSPPIESPLDASVAVDPAGDAVTAWEGLEGSTQVIQVANRGGAAGAWSAPVTLSGANTDASQPVVAFDGKGGVTALWHYQSNPSYDLESSVYDPGTAVAPAGPEGGEVTGQGGSPPAGDASPPGQATPTPVLPSTPAPGKARCPKGKALRTVKVRARGKGKAKFKTVRKCVKAAPRHKHNAKHLHPKGK